MSDITNRIRTAHLDVVVADHAFSAINDFIENSDLPDRIKTIWASGAGRVCNAHKALSGEDYEEAK